MPAAGESTPPPSAGRNAGGPALRLAGISKRFGAIVANDDVSISLDRGEVLALLGENGAGKSTLVSILFGHYVADAGTIEVFGRPLPPGDPAAALAAGIGMVHQHFSLADNLTVLDNVLAGTEPWWRPRSARLTTMARLRQLSEEFGLVVDPQARVGDLSIGEKQRVEIMKALVRGARILILDEPTAVLTPQEAQGLFDTLGRFVAKGLSIVFISHKLDEVLRVSDRIVVLRGGHKTLEVAAKEATRDSLALAMVGREVARPAHLPRVPGAVVLSLRAVHAPGRVPLVDVSLEVRAGEIVAIAGVAGNGQRTVADLLSGLTGVSAGTLAVEGRALAASPSAWQRAKVGRIPEDRQGEGVIGDARLWENAVVESLPDRYARFGWIRRGEAIATCAELIRRFDIRGGEPATLARRLSGGNLQKLILGRVLAVEPTLIVASQPTWGLDVGAVAYVHGQLLAARDRGAALLLISEDLDEIFAIADRIAVIAGGRLTEARPARDWSAESLGIAMAGDHRERAVAA